MAFNLAPYNQNPFNVSGEPIRHITAIGSEEVYAVIGPDLEIYPLGVGNERISCEIEGYPAKFISASGNEEVTEQTEGFPTVFLMASFKETIGKIITQAPAVIYPIVNYKETIGEIIPGASAGLFIKSKASVNIAFLTGSGAHSPAAKVYLKAQGFELVTESATLNVVDLRSCVLNLTLQPGQQLIVDAESYTVLLNGENAIDLQKGDWIDELDRSTQGLSIKASAGVANLTAKIIYTEKYL